jgi:hypothetical protein
LAGGIRLLISSIVIIHALPGATWETTSPNPKWAPGGDRFSIGLCRFKGEFGTHPHRVLSSGILMAGSGRGIPCHPVTCQRASALGRTRRFRRDPENGCYPAHLRHPVRLGKPLSFKQCLSRRRAGRYRSRRGATRQRQVLLVLLLRMRPGTPPHQRRRRILRG